MSQCHLDRWQAVFPSGLALLSFCSSKANPTPTHRQCGALQKDQCLQPRLFHVSKQPAAVVYAAAAMVGRYAHTKSPNIRYRPCEEGAIWGQQKTPIHPSSNEWFWEMRVLFPVLRYIYGVNIDILKGNSFDFGV
jgi:hypothetical protein